jgi:hypothetical protein
MARDDDKLSVSELLQRAAAIDDIDTFKQVPRLIGLANSKIGIENNQLTKRTQDLTESQIRISARANELTEKLLFSNEQAGKQSEHDAELMYKATEQLATSTRSLNRATWVLVAFTAVQALIAIAALYVSMRLGK